MKGASACLGSEEGAERAHGHAAELVHALASRGQHDLLVPLEGLSRLGRCLFARHGLRLEYGERARRLGWLGGVRRLVRLALGAPTLLILLTVGALAVGVLCRALDPHLTSELRVLHVVSEALDQRLDDELTGHAPQRRLLLREHPHGGGGQARHMHVRRLEHLWQQHEHRSAYLPVLVAPAHDSPQRDACEQVHLRTRGEQHGAHGLEVGLHDVQPANLLAQAVRLDDHLQLVRRLNLLGDAARVRVEQGAVIPLVQVRDIELD